jgi:hypothetical protein
MKRHVMMLAAAIALLGLTGCTGKGPMQKTGERVDEIVDNVEKGDPPLKKKGPMEKMGDSIDDAMQKTDNK